MQYTLYFTDNVNSLKNRQAMKEIRRCSDIKIHFNQVNLNRIFYFDLCNIFQF